MECLGILVRSKEWLNKFRFTQSGFDFRMVPNGVAVTIRYYIKAETEAPDDDQFIEQSLTVGITAAQAKDLANSFERAVQLIENPSKQWISLLTQPSAAYPVRAD